jgi:hypothetical protein
VSVPDDEHFWLVTDDSSCRTVAEIERKVVKQSNRGSASRLLHAKNDKEKIAAWRLDLNRILHVFQVDPVASLLISLIVCLQTELAINAHVAISDVGQGVSDTHAVVTGTNVVVSDTHAIVSDTHAVVSDIRRAIAKNQEVADDSDRPVSSCRSLLVFE